MFVFKLFIISFFLLSVPYGVGCLVRHKPLSRAQPLISEQDSPTYHDPMVFNIVSLRISVPRLASKSSVVGTYSSLRLPITCPKNADGLFLVCLTCTLRECGHYCWTFFLKLHLLFSTWLARPVCDGHLVIHCTVLRSAVDFHCSLNGV